MTLIIRRCKYEDFDDLVDRINEFDIEENKKVFKTTLTSGELFSLMNSNEKDIIVASYEKRVVGYLRFDLKNPEYPRSLMIDELYVAPKFRRRGIANNLTKEAIETAKQNSIPYIYTKVRELNTPNIQNNINLGFTLFQREKNGNYLLTLRKEL